jgi:hypothetical protein
MKKLGGGANHTDFCTEPHECAGARAMPIKNISTVATFTLRAPTRIVDVRRESWFVSCRHMYIIATENEVTV